MRGEKKTLDKKGENLKLRKIAQKQKMKERGITLIALVVTIIILLILAGVTLNIALSDNGLFSKAKDAADRYKVAQIEEELEMYQLQGKLEGKELKDVLVENELIDEEKLTTEGITEINESDKKLVIDGEKGLSKISDEVENGNDYTGVTIYLLDNITMSSDQYKPIGDSNSDIGDEELETSKKSMFNGTFDGLNHEIKNLNVVEIEDTDYCTGLFGYVGENGIVENITISDSSISGRRETGAIVGRNRGKVYNCINNSQVDGKELTGGIVGRNLGTVENCTNNGSVKSSNSQLGGIAGNNSSTVRNCTNFGYVGEENSGEDMRIIGGIVGYGNGIIENSKNYGNVKGYSRIGGIVGQIYCTNDQLGIDRCENNGEITGRNSRIGGICGENLGGSITFSKNVGKIFLVGSEATYGIGGIAGASGGNSKNTKIEGCYNSGMITLDMNSTDSDSSGQIAAILEWVLLMELKLLSNLRL